MNENKNQFNRRVEDKLGSETRPLPEDDHDAVTQLWTAMIGFNGGGFLTKFDKFMETVVTKEMCSSHQEKLADEKKEKQRKLKNCERLFFATITFLSFIFGKDVLTFISEALKGVLK